MSCVGTTGHTVASQTAGQGANSPGFPRVFWVRAASFNSMVQNSLRILEHAFTDSEFARFLHKAESDPSALSPEERVRWDAYMTAVYRHFGNLVYQHRVGALDQEMWTAYERTLRKRHQMPSWSAWFQEHKEIFSTSLVEQVERIQG